MDLDSLDDVDRGILHLLQVDARNNTTSEIGEQVDVSASTVGNRIRKLEERDIINGYHPNIDYRKAGLPIHTLFVCTAPVPSRSELADQAIDVYGVVDVRETIAGTHNLHVEAISRTIDELEDVTRALDDLGLEIKSSEMLKRHQTRPFDHFGSDLIED